jgi:polyisoprenoid-binding protein YceI
MRLNSPRILAVWSLAVLPFLVACESEIDNKPAAAVKEVPASAKKSPPPPPPSPSPVAGAKSGDKAKPLPVDGWALAPSSAVTWVGAKVTKDHKGGFKTLRGSAKIDGDKISSGVLQIDLTSLYSDHPKLEKHLRSPDFFDVQTYPTATFTFTEVAADSVTGTLDLHGVKKELSFPAKVTVTDAAATIAAEFTLLRKDFGMTYPGKSDDLIRDEVLVKGDLKFAR